MAEMIRQVVVAAAPLAPEHADQIRNLLSARPTPAEPMARGAA